MYTCTFLHQLTQQGRRGHFDDGWTVGLLDAAIANADAQAAHCQAWLHWLPIDYGTRAYAVKGGLN
jgi:hypothetical protein